MTPGNTIITNSARETFNVGQRFAHQLAGDEVLLLFGDLGSGKTVLTQGVATGLGVHSADVQSPTYTLIHEYWRQGESAEAGDPPRVIHVDLYRLSAKEIESTGLDESLTGPGVKIVEWADRLPGWPGDAWMITIEQLTPERRRIEIRREGG